MEGNGTEGKGRKGGDGLTFAFPPGQFETATPCSLAATRSIVSQPVPFRLMIRNLGALRMSSPDILPTRNTRRTSLVSSCLRVEFEISTIQTP